MPPTNTAPAMGDQEDAPATFDDTAEHECGCSHENAQELHSLVVALAAHKGIDLCGRMHDMDDDEDMHDDDDVIELHDLDDIDDDEDEDEGDESDESDELEEEEDENASNLQLIHDLLVAQGAHCEGMDDLDDEDDEDDSSGEHPAFSVGGGGDTDEDTAPPATFRDWPKAKRDKTPIEDFAGEDETFPIMDQADVDAAAKLIGRAADPEKTKARIKAIAKRKGLTIPAAWATDATANMAEFVQTPAFDF